MAIKNKLDLIFKELGISGRKAEKMCGLADGTYSSIGDGVGVDKLQKILFKFPQINTDWLILDKGSMLREVPTKEEGNNEMWELIKSQQETIRELSKKLPATPACTPTNVK
ncbi:MAG: hypothetical protein ACRCSB_03505, partial [Bacteroidales bacterium]